MVESGPGAILPVEFATQRHPDLPVEAIDRSEIFAKVLARRLARPERVAFDELVLMRSSGGAHTVDFERIPAAPGRLIRIRPGQVQAWDTDATFEATLVLSKPAVTSASPWFPGDRAYRDLDGAERALVIGLIDGIRDQQASFADAEPERRLLAALVSAIVAVFERAPGEQSPSRLPAAYTAFRDAIEGDLGASHDVTDYAERLGYSPRTLSRACRAATGLTAKAVLDERLLLEAKRRLVHSDATAASIAVDLGFSEPTNFGKFFTRLTDRSPARFRAAHR